MMDEPQSLPFDVSKMDECLIVSKKHAEYAKYVAYKGFMKVSAYYEAWAIAHNSCIKHVNDEDSVTYVQWYTLRQLASELTWRDN